MMQEVAQGPKTMDITKEAKGKRKPIHCTHCPVMATFVKNWSMKASQKTMKWNSCEYQTTVGRVIALMDTQLSARRRDGYIAEQAMHIELGNARQTLHRDAMRQNPTGLKGNKRTQKDHTSCLYTFTGTNAKYH